MYKGIINTIFFILIIVFIGSCKKDELQWHRIIKLLSHTTARLNRIKVLPNDKLLVCGGEKFTEADLLTSNDGGKTWTLTSFPEVGKSFYGLAVSPSGNIYMTGFDAKLFFTKNNGTSWELKQVSNWKYNVGLAYPTDDLGIAISTITQDSGTITLLTDRGDIKDEWKQSFGLNDIDMANTTTGYISGYGGVIKTTDAGNTWQFQQPHNDNFTAIDCHGENTVYMCGYEGTIYKTTNGGSTWHMLRNGNNLTLKKYHLLDILFIDELNGYATGENGVVLYSDDGGDHWMEYEHFTSSSLRFIAQAPDGYMIVGGDDGVLYRIEQ